MVALTIRVRPTIEAIVMAMPTMFKSLVEYKMGPTESHRRKKKSIPNHPMQGRKLEK